MQVQRDRMNRVNHASASRRGKEQEKRDQLAAELQAALEPPLNAGVTLTRREREREAERVRTGISAQTFYAKGGSTNTRTGE